MAEPVFHNSVKNYGDYSNKRNETQKQNLVYEGPGAVKSVAVRLETLEKEVSDMRAVISKIAEGLSGAEGKTTIVPPKRGRPSEE